MGDSYVPVDVTPNIPDYTISADLSNIVNLDQFTNLNAEQKAKLASNGFVVAPGYQEQLFYIYEDNTYKKIPNFVTADSVLQVYHIFYDYALRSTEYETLLPNVQKLNSNMLAQMQKEYAAITNPEVKAEALKVLGYFGVAQRAFGQDLPADYPEEAKTLVEQEMVLFDAAGGKQPYPTVLRKTAAYRRAPSGDGALIYAVQAISGGDVLALPVVLRLFTDYSQTVLNL
jgi:hypothetical protein